MSTLTASYFSSPQLDSTRFPSIQQEKSPLFDIIAPFPKKFPLIFASKTKSPLEAMKKILITTNTPTRRPAPAVWVYSFEKYLRRKLSDRERSIITLLERQHHRQLKGHLPQPQLVIDPPGFDSSALLRDYLNYRLDKLDNPDIRTVVFAPGTEYKAQNLNPQTRKKERIRYCNYRAINRFRGSSLGFMLLLNIQDAETCSPFYSHPVRFQQLCRVLFPMQSPFGFLIMHLRLPDNVASVAKFIQHLPQAIKRHIATKPKSPDPPPPVTVVTEANILQTIGQAIKCYVFVPGENGILNSQFTILNSKVRPL